MSAEDVQEMIRQHNESEDAHPDKADLGEDGKVLPEQLPEMDVSTAMAGFDTKDALADADGIVITDSAAENAGKRVLWSKVKELLGKLYVPLTRKINNKALSSDITLSAADVGAAAASHTHALDALTGILPVNKGGTGQSSLEALLAALKQAGAVQIATGSYVGTGTYGADHPCSLTFDFSPKLVIVYEIGTGLIPLNVAGFWQNSFIWCPGQDSLKIGQAWGHIRQETNSIRWDGVDAIAQLNELNTTYFYVAIG